MADLVELNKLRRNPVNVHVSGADVTTPGFVYSDGAESEQYLREVLSSAADLSSSSYELQRRIRDWPSEYHLAPQRANLLRGLDLGSVSRVLELGCGCGALTRYLGEQGIAVDAVEGAPVRAELAALRCAGLDNINIVCANFSELEIPVAAYDLVLFVGVTEYAGRFSSEISDEDALQDLLQIARRAITKSGIVLVAIENRTGLKYVMGANEDHYGTQYVGIHDYPDDEGIRTYTRKEWLRHISRSGFEAHEFLYPFPDYKIPTVVLSEDYVSSNPWAYCHLEGIHSRDYLSVLELEHSEQLAWEAAVASGSLGDYTNSFCILLASDEKHIRGLSTADFAHLPGFGRKAAYCTLIRKIRGEELVRRELLFATGDSQDNAGIRHLPAAEEEFIRGPLLSVQWSRSLLIYNGFERFESLVAEYYGYLKSYRDSGKTLTIDLVPSNIVVTDGGYRIIDEEWWVDWEITPEFLLYRAVVMFVFRHRSIARALAEDKRLYSPTDLVRYCFDLVGLPHDFETLRAYALQDERLQSSVSERYIPLDMEMPLVGSLHEFPPNLAVYWRQKDAGYDPALVASTQAGTTTDRQVINIRLPDGVSRFDYLRFDPSGEFRQELAGFFRLYRVEAWQVAEEGSEQSVWVLSGESEIAEHAGLVGMRYESRDLGPGFCIVDEDAWMEFEFIPRRRFGASSHYRLEVELRYPRSTQYLLARDRYLVSAEVLEERREEIELILEDYHDKRQELEDIKNSKVWIQAEHARELVYVKFLPAMSRAGEQLMRPFRALRRHGVIGLPLHLARRIGQRFAPATQDGAEPLPPTDYEKWLDERPNDYWVRASAVTISPTVSILVPVYDPPLDVLARAIDSVLGQTYPYWELCLADDCSTNSQIRAYLANLDHPQIKVVFRDQNGNISAASNSAADLATGEYITLLDHDDELTPNALLEMVFAVQESGADFVYSDEDFINLDGQLGFPHFKPDYAPELLLSQNYITHLMFMRRELFERAGRFRTGFEGAQDYDLCLRAVELADKVEHVAKPLYHWRMLETSTSFDPNIKPEAHSSARRAIEEAMARRGERAVVLDGNLSHYFQVRRELEETPLVSIVIPFKDRPGLLRKCIGTILEKSTYNNFEIVGVSNDTLTPSSYELMRELEERDDRVQFIEANIAFNFSKLVNSGAAAARGEHIVLMNNDIEILTPDWIELLLEHSLRQEIGVVGAKLYFPDNTIQHAGVVTGLGGYAGHIHKNFPGYHEGYFNRLKMIQNLTAMTAALMMVKKTIYDELGGFDEQDFAVAYNDVDFCLRAWQAGYRNVFTPYCEAIHHESKSRGYEVTPVKSERFRREMENFATRYREIIKAGDPYHNPNFNKLHDDYRYV